MNTDLVTPRRTFLKLALGGVAGASLAALPVTRALARTKAEPITITPITDSIAQVTGAGSNVVVFTSREGVAMIDGGLIFFWQPPPLGL